LTLGGVGGGTTAKGSATRKRIKRDDEQHRSRLRPVELDASAKEQRGAPSGTEGTLARALALQETAGNRATTTLLRQQSVQREAQKIAPPAKATGHPDASVVKSVVSDLETELKYTLHGAGSDPEGALQSAAAAAGKLKIPASCSAPTRSALQAMLDGVSTAVNRAFAEGKQTLLVAPSDEEIETKQAEKIYEGKRKRYSDKMGSHAAKHKKARTAFGKDYERNRYKHYERKKAALGDDSRKLMEFARPTEDRKKKVAGTIFVMLDDMKKGIDAAYAIVGNGDKLAGKKSLGLPEGTDPHETVNLLLRSYAGKLFTDAGY